MHSFTWGSYVFHHNADLSGRVEIVYVTAKESKPVASIPGTALLCFIAEYVRGRRMSALEDADVFDLFGIPNDRPEKYED
jgi:hypothetical protein